VLAVIIGFFKLPHIPSAEAHRGSENSGSYRDLLFGSRYRHLQFGVLAIFFYVGGEVAIGSFLTNYINRPEIGNLSLKDAADLLKYYWGGAMVGRFVGSALLQRIPTGKLLAFNGTMAAAMVVVSMNTHGHVAMWSILLVGLFNSIMFPSIFTLAIDGLGPMTSKGSGLLVAAIVGGAIIPELQGIAADRIGIQHALFLPAICYVYIVYFALKGSKHSGTDAVEA
jgi:MFS transporter, FHS family, L-fucose permease